MKETETHPSNNYPEPSPELIDDLQKRLADVPRETLERARHALMHEPIQTAGTILYKAGVCLCSAELYEYRKTLFPPNALIDPLTQDAPVVRHSDVGGRASSRAEPPSADSSPATCESAIQPSNDPLIHLSAPSAGASLLNDLRSLLNRFVQSSVGSGLKYQKAFDRT